MIGAKGKMMGSWHLSGSARVTPGQTPGCWIKRENTVMSDNCTHIVPVHKGDYPDDHAKVKEILYWFQKRGMVENALSDCTLGEPGYRFLPEISRIFDEEPRPDSSEHTLLTHGLELHHGSRRVFHPMEGADLHFACPECNHDMGWDAADGISAWYEREDDYPQCRNCAKTFHITEYRTDHGGKEPPWAFSNVAITLWNAFGEAFAPWFLDEMKTLYGTDILVVEVRI
ncbi:hypothetical protein ACEK07_22570 [Alcanivoracaceae bacterium MT1]